MTKVRIAIIGVGNCASSLIQGLSHYKENDNSEGLIHEIVGGYKAKDIEVVLAYDIDERKVGKDLSEAIFSAPNNTLKFNTDLPTSGVNVSMGPVLDGVAPHMLQAGERGFKLSTETSATGDEVVEALKASKVDILVNFLPVGSQDASEFYIDCALQAGVAVVNCIPVFIASDPVWAKKFEDAKLPIIGDDIKAQIGATIIHRMLSDLFSSRGVSIKRTYQLNTGGNTDFMNMLDRSRLQHKKESKTEAVQAALATRLADENILIGPAEYVPWQEDNKVCFLRIEGEHWGGSPVHVEMRLAVEDSPNSAACVLDAIRFAKLSLDNEVGGPIIVPSAYFCKHPPEQIDEGEAAKLLADVASGALKVSGADFRKAGNG